jgi:serine/threonine-protein kinase RsbW
MKSKVAALIASLPIETTSRILDSTLESADLVENVTLQSARRAGFFGIALEKIGLAVHEIVINAIIHGNGLNRQKKVFATIARTRKQLTVTVSDQGGGFDLNRLPDFRSPEALLKKSGRGIYLAQAFMDEFHVHSGAGGGAMVTLVKYIRGTNRRPAPRRGNAATQ